MGATSSTVSGDVPESGDGATTFAPPHGITVAGVVHFIEECGGRDAVKGKTTLQVMEEYIKRGLDEGKSICMRFQENPETIQYVGIATHYVIHAWRYEFLTLVDTLHASIPTQTRATTSLWIDVFSLYVSDILRGKNGRPSSARWLKHLPELFERYIKHTLLVLTPWYDPLALKRSWCNFEIFCAVRTGCSLEIVMPQEQHSLFHKALLEDFSSIKTYISKVALDHGEAFAKEDSLAIRDYIEQHSDINVPEVIFALLRDLLCVSGSEFLKTARIEDDQARFTLMDNVSQLLQDQGRLSEAEALSRKCYQKRKAVLGAGHPDTLLSMTNLGSLLNKLAKYTEAKNMLNATLSLSEASMGKSHLTTLTAMNNLAYLFQDLHEYSKSEAMFEKCYTLAKDALGPTNHHTLLIMNNLASVLRYNQNLKRAQQIVEECFQLRKEHLGETHPDTLITANNYASLLRAQGRNQESLELHLATLRKRQTRLGRDHPDSLVSMENVGILFAATGRHVEGAKMMYECFTLKEAKFGITHPSTQITLDYLKPFAHYLPADAELPEVLDKDAPAGSLHFPHHLRAPADKTGRDSISQQSSHVDSSSIRPGTMLVVPGEPETEGNARNSDMGSTTASGRPKRSSVRNKEAARKGGKKGCSSNGSAGSGTGGVIDTAENNSSGIIGAPKVWGDGKRAIAPPTIVNTRAHKVAISFDENTDSVYSQCLCNTMYCLMYSYNIPVIFQLLTTENSKTLLNEASGFVIVRGENYLSRKRGEVEAIRQHMTQRQVACIALDLTRAAEDHSNGRGNGDNATPGDRGDRGVRHTRRASSLLADLPLIPGHPLTDLRPVAEKLVSWTTLHVTVLLAGSSFSESWPLADSHRIRALVSQMATRVLPPRPSQVLFRDTVHVECAITQPFKQQVRHISALFEEDRLASGNDTDLIPARLVVFNNLHHWPAPNSAEREDLLSALPFPACQRPRDCVILTIPLHREGFPPLLDEEGVKDEEHLTLYRDLIQGFYLDLYDTVYQQSNLLSITHKTPAMIAAEVTEAQGTVPALQLPFDPQQCILATIRKGYLDTSTIAAFCRRVALIRIYEHDRQDMILCGFLLDRNVQTTTTTTTATTTGAASTSGAYSARAYADPAELISVLKFDTVYHLELTEAAGPKIVSRYATRGVQFLPDESILSLWGQLCSPPVRVCLKIASSSISSNSTDDADVEMSEVEKGASTNDSTPDTLAARQSKLKMWAVRMPNRNFAVLSNMVITGLSTVHRPGTASLLRGVWGNWLIFSSIVDPGIPPESLGTVLLPGHTAYVGDDWQEVFDIIKGICDHVVLDIPVGRAPTTGRTGLGSSGWRKRKREPTAADGQVLPAGSHPLKQESADGIHSSATYPPPSMAAPAMWGHAPGFPAGHPNSNTPQPAPAPPPQMQVHMHAAMNGQAINGVAMGQQPQLYPGAMMRNVFPPASAAGMHNGTPAPAPAPAARVGPVGSHDGASALLSLFSGPSGVPASTATPAPLNGHLPGTAPHPMSVGVPVSGGSALAPPLPSPASTQGYQVPKLIPAVEPPKKRVKSTGMVNGVELCLHPLCVKPKAANRSENFCRAPHGEWKDDIRKIYTEKRFGPPPELLFDPSVARTKTAKFELDHNGIDVRFKAQRSANNQRHCTVEAFKEAVALHDFGLSIEDLENCRVRLIVLSKDKQTLPRSEWYNHLHQEDPNPDGTFYRGRHERGTWIGMVIYVKDSPPTVAQLQGAKNLCNKVISGKLRQDWESLKAIIATQVNLLVSQNIGQLGLHRIEGVHQLEPDFLNILDFDRDPSSPYGWRITLSRRLEHLSYERLVEDAKRLLSLLKRLEKLSFLSDYPYSRIKRWILRLMPSCEIRETMWWNPCSWWFTESRVDNDSGDKPQEGEGVHIGLLLLLSRLPAGLDPEWHYPDWKALILWDKSLPHAQLTRLPKEVIVSTLKAVHAFTGRHQVMEAESLDWKRRHEWSTFFSTPHDCFMYGPIVHPPIEPAPRAASATPTPTGKNSKGKGSKAGKGKAGKGKASSRSSSSITGTGGSDKALSTDPSTDSLATAPRQSSKPPFIIEHFYPSVEVHLDPTCRQCRKEEIDMCRQEIAALWSAAQPIIVIHHAWLDPLSDQADIDYLRKWCTQNLGSDFRIMDSMASRNPTCPDDEIIVRDACRQASAVLCLTTPEYLRCAAGQHSQYTHFPAEVHEVSSRIRHGHSVFLLQAPSTAAAVGSGNVAPIPDAYRGLDPRNQRLDVTNPRDSEYLVAAIRSRGSRGGLHTRING